jgi:hypothetical protein
MGVYAGIITSVIGGIVKLIGSSQSPNYPSPPKLAKINIPQAQGQMEDYEKARMQASIDAWKKGRFPLLYKGGQYEIGDIAQNQQGQLSDSVAKSVGNAGYTAVTGKNQEDLSQQIGLSPITLSQRTSEAVNRNIALNPEWTNKISGGTLATMIANNNQNQNAFNQFLGANNTAQYIAGQQRSQYNTAALTSGLLGGAALGTQAYQNQQNPLNRPLDPTAYPTSYGYAGGQGVYSQPQQMYPPQGSGGYSPSSGYNPYQNPYGNSYNTFMQPMPSNFVTPYGY